MKPCRFVLARRVLIGLGLACLPLLAAAARIEELPLPPEGGTAGVSNIAADGTVVGTLWPVGQVLRWRPGQAPENLGGDTFTLENVIPLISADGATIVASHYFWTQGSDVPEAAPAIWSGTAWQRIGGLVLGDATPFGLADDGSALAGAAYPAEPPPPGGFVALQPWTWTEAGGQVPLDLPAGHAGGQAWAVSPGALHAAGFVFEATGGARYGTRWDGTTAQLILDAGGSRVGQAIACNSDCSVIVGAGIDGASGSPQAWRWTAATGVTYLGTVAGALPDAKYYAFDTNQDGTLIVGSYYTIDPLFGPSNRGFVWQADGGIEDVVDFLADRGIDYGSGFGDLVVNAMTRDGAKLLLNGMDGDFQRRRAVVHLDGEAIFADGFEP
ncbi:hypothetical protein [Dokdonella koreensis]|uniref:Autotransporter n=1 Tax=Dokdonella koreensis DS-123 TaxID=1300342 RepID=A0A167H4M6_9GAMM|nr:hypothetical protein [Dokdonella koreensis]ANB18896.1 Autotransporter [Dokdonella koreensis DS-123]